MSGRKQIAQLISDFAASIGIPEMRLDDDGTCSLLFDGSLTVHIAHLEAEQVLALFCYLGQPRGDRAGLYRRLLEANFFWNGAAGATLSLESESGGVVLMDRVPTHGLHLPAFTAALEGFVNAAEGWRGRLEAAEDRTAEHEPAGSTVAPHLSGHIRA